jgi:hypothetical protein
MPPPTGLPNPTILKLKEQEIPYDDQHSCFMFEKQFVSTANALHTFGPAVILTGLIHVQEKATQKGGLDYLQVFKNPSKLEFDGKDLWFIEDTLVVTALLPEDY